MATLFILSICLLAGKLEHRENLLVNPSFEEDRDRDARPDGWRPLAFESPARLDWDNSVRRGGNRSVRISDSFRPGDQRDWKRCTGRWPFLRGDSNEDGKVDLSDVIKILEIFFTGSPPLRCSDAGDVNDDGELDISDPITTLLALFAGQGIPPPGPESCGPDPTIDVLTCDLYIPCE